MLEYAIGVIVIVLGLSGTHFKVIECGASSHIKVATAVSCCGCGSSSVVVAAMVVVVVFCDSVTYILMLFVAMLWFRSFVIALQVIL